MKHPLGTTLLLVVLFVVAQVVGLVLVNLSIVSVHVNVETGQTELAHDTTAIGDRPDFLSWQTFLWIGLGVVIGTSLILLIIHFKKVHLWKAWFMLAVFLALYVSFGVLFPFPQFVVGVLTYLGFPPVRLIAFILALSLAYWKIHKPNPWVHNLTEVFLYAGIAVLLVPILDVFWSLALLLAISLYDAWAVWKSKHMVALAEFQKGSQVFAGLMVPKPAAKHAVLSAPKKAKAAKNVKVLPLPPRPTQATSAILGGGDIAFPLIFTGTVMEGLLLGGASRVAAFSEALLVTLGATVALALLFFYAKKNKYYPAMPFLTAGCLLGWLVTFLI